jgi:hypothetical protein
MQEGSASPKTDPGWALSIRPFLIAVKRQTAYASISEVSSIRRHHG